MPFFRRSPLRRQRDGTFSLALPDQGRVLLADLATQLTTMLDEAPDDPALARLFPTAYLEDPFRDAEYQVIAGDELRDSRRSALATLRSTADAETLTEEQVIEWMQAINALRLVIGTRLDVGEDDDDRMWDFDGPDGTLRYCYVALTEMLGIVIAALDS